MKVNIIKDLIGKTFDEVYVVKNEDTGDQEELHFKNKTEHYYFFHEQDCCEKVFIYDICGNIFDLQGSEIIEAEEAIGKNIYDNNLVSVTWTFYKFRTQNGCVVVRWLGESNGYYSEHVDFKKIE